MRIPLRTCLALFALVACQATPPGSLAGVLFIAGGAVQDSGPLMPRFFAEADRAAARRGFDTTHVEVVPTASGDPAKSLEVNVRDMGWIANHATIGGLLLDSNNPYSNEDLGIADRLRSASAIWFTGGDQKRIVSLFRPGRFTDPGSEEAGRTSPIDEAVHDALEAGGLIGGSSAGAAMMSTTMIAGGSSEDALLSRPGEDGFGLVPGMDFYPFGFVDQHFLARGRYGRLLVAMQSSGERFGAGIDENCAWIVTLGDRPMCEALGQNAVCLLDLGKTPQPAEFNVWTAQLSLLGTGDRWNPRTNELLPRPTRIPAPLQPERALEAFNAQGPWDKGALLNALLRLSRNPNQPQTLANERFEVTLSSGPETRFLVAAEHGSDLFAERVRLRIAKKSANPGSESSR